MNLSTFNKPISASNSALLTLVGLVSNAVGIVCVLSPVAARRFEGWSHGVFNWLEVTNFPKPVIFLAYLGIFGILLSGALAGYFINRHREALDARIGQTTGRLLIWTSGGAVLAAAAGVNFSLAGNFSAGRLYVLAGLALVAFPWIEAFSRSRARARVSPAWACPPLALGALPLLIALAFTPFSIPNEFLSLSERTHLKNGEIVDNVEYINNNNIEGLKIPDPRSGNGYVAARVIKIKPGDQIAIKLAEKVSWNNAKNIIFYQDRNEIEIIGNVDIDDARLINSIADPAEIEKSNLLLKASVIDAKRSDAAYYTERDSDFISKNRLELRRALVLGYYFYHQNFLLSQAIVLATDGVTSRWSQYGKGMTEVLAEILKATPKHLWFNTYLITMYIGYLVYLALMVAGARSMALSWWPTAFVAAVTVLTYVLPELATTKLAEGLSPWRHMADVVALTLLHRHIRAPRAWSTVAIPLFIGLATYWSRETGAFIGAAVGGLPFLAALGGGNRRDLVRGFLGMAACAIASVAGLILGDPHAPTHQIATLYGINTPDVPSGLIATLSGCLGLLGVGWWTLRPSAVTGSKDGADWVVAGAGVAYCSLSAVYLVWYPSVHHLILMLPVLGLAVTLLYGPFMSRVPRMDVLGPITIVVVLGCVSLLGVQRLWEAWTEALVFSTHDVHDWNLPAGQIRSTAEPMLVEKTIDQITRNEPGVLVNILSPWEILVLQLAGKANGGPYAVTFDSFLFKDDFRILVDNIIKSPSPILFVDTRIMNGYYEGRLSRGTTMTDLIPAQDARIAAHAALRKVFEKIKGCYQRIEDGPLLTVYRRKDEACVVAGS